MNPKSIIRVFIIPVTAMVIGLLLTISCNEEYQYSHGSIYGTVIDANTKKPVEVACNVRVINIDGEIVEEQIADKDGYYKTKDIPEGTYTLSVEAEDYYSGDSRTVQVRSGETTQCDVALGRLPAKITADVEEIDFGEDESLTYKLFSIDNRYLDDLEWTAEFFCEWISSVTPNEGTLSNGATETIRVTIDRSKLSVGLNKTNIGVRSKNGQGGGVNISVIATGRDRPSFLTVEPGILDFGKQSSITHRSFKLINDTGKDQEWYLSEYTCPWITSVTPSNGTLKKNLTETVEVVIDRGKLQGGNNQTILTIASTNGHGSMEIHVQAIGEDRWDPIVNVKEATSVDRMTAVLNGEIIDVGAPVYTQRGFSYFTKQDESDAALIYAAMDDSHYFSANLANLSPGTTYYVKAFASNKEDSPTWSTNRVSFTTIGEYPSVQTDNVTNINVVANTCVFNGTILSTGSPVYSEKGFCYNTTGEPTLSNSHVSVSGASSGAFSYSCNLGQHSNYYVRAYVIQAGRQPIYGNTVSFSTNLTSTKVLSYAATNVTGTTATLNGAITEVGVPSYTEKGFCYTEGYHTPNITSSNKVSCSGTDTGDFLKTISVKYNTDYSFRAYAIQNGEPIYGETLYFTSSYTKASVMTLDVSNQDYEKVTLNAEITEMGDPAISECGFCYVDYEGNSYHYPTISDKKVKAIIGKDFSIVLDNTELNGKTEYCYRSYVIQNDKVIYGDAKFFTSYVKPQVIVGPVINLVSTGDGTWTATFQGAFADGCWPAVTGLAFVYGPDPNPTLDNKTAGIATTNYTYNSSVNAYVFIANAKNIPGNQTFYVRALVTTSLGVFYSNNTSDGKFSTY